MITVRELWVAVAVINSTVWAASDRQPSGFWIAVAWICWAVLLCFWGKPAKAGGVA